MAQTLGILCPHHPLYSPCVLHTEIPSPSLISWCWGSHFAPLDHWHGEGGSWRGFRGRRQLS